MGNQPWPQFQSGIRERSIDAQFRQQSLKLKVRIMVKFSTEEQKFMVGHFFGTRNGYEVVRRFQQHFPNRPIPVLSTVLYNFRKYERHGTSENRNKSHSGRRRTVTDDTTTAELTLPLPGGGGGGGPKGFSSITFEKNKLETPNFA